MKEARVVVTGFLTIPETIFKVRQDFEERLINEFGGYILYPARGGWRDDDGQAVVMDTAVYDIAIHQWQEEHLLYLVKWLKDTTKQRSVYFRRPFKGDVVFV